MPTCAARSAPRWSATRRTSPRAPSRPRRRAGGWRTSCSPRCWGGASSTGRRPRGSRSTATSRALAVEVVRTGAALRTARARLPGPVGAVLTMGALHAGHRSLVERARAECRSVVATIFVNPTQFGPAEDLARYPRDEAADLALLGAAGADLVFVPPVEEIYGPGFATSIDVGPIAEPLEGAARPGHFRGVATVVAILFELVRPERAYFGQKDAQQALVVRRLVDDLAMPIEIT